MLRRLVIKHGHESKRKKDLSECEVLYTRWLRCLSEFHSGSVLFLRRGLDVVGEPCLKVERRLSGVLVRPTRDNKQTYQALEDIGSICCDTGRNVPQLVLQLGQLKLLGDLLGAQVWRVVSMGNRRTSEQNRG